MSSQIDTVARSPKVQSETDDQRAEDCEPIPKQEGGAQKIKNQSDHKNKRQKQEEPIKVTTIWDRPRSAAKTLESEKTMTARDQG